MFRSGCPGMGMRVGGSGGTPSSAPLATHRSAGMRHRGPGLQKGCRRGCREDGLSPLPLVLCREEKLRKSLRRNNLPVRVRTTPCLHLSFPRKIKFILVPDPNPSSTRERDSPVSLMLPETPPAKGLCLPRLQECWRHLLSRPLGKQTRQGQGQRMRRQVGASG